MKHWCAILFSMLLAWSPYAPAQALPDCAKSKMASCDMPCCQKNCSMTQGSCGSQPAPAVPAQKTGAQNQISLLAPAVVLWTVPENFANSFSSVSASPLMATGVPLYERNCALLL
jgi:hypothetical protein